MQHGNTRAARLSIFGVLALLALATGCSGPARSDLTVSCINKPDCFAQSFKDAYVTRGSHGELDVVMAGEVRRADGTIHPSLQQLVHVRVLYDPTGMYNADKLGATNAAIKWYVIAKADGGTEVLEYTGTGMVKVKADDETIEFAIHNGTLQPTMRRGKLNDPIGPARVEGTVVAQRDAERADALLSQVRNTAASARVAAKSPEVRAAAN